MPGIDAERFVNSVPDEILCPVCCYVLNEPVSTSCGHLICGDCYTAWFDEHQICPCCHANAHAEVVHDATQQQRQCTMLAWKLIQQFDVYCRNFSAGCTVVTKLCLENYHLRECPFEKSETRQSSDCGSASSNGRDATTKTNCDYCLCTVITNEEETHNCWLSVKELVKRQTSQLTNLGFENERLSLELIRKENDLLDHITTLESEHQRRALKEEREIRELRRQIAAGDLKQAAMQTEDIQERINLTRRNGSLGFNIVGGVDVEGSRDGVVSAISVSRVIDTDDRTHAQQLQVNDHILEVNGVSLRGASHARAVEVIKATTDPVELLIGRRLVSDRPTAVSTSTQTAIVPTSHRLQRSRSLEQLTDSANLSCSDECLSHLVSTVKRGEDAGRFASHHDSYDSAYDTLMTNRSTRSDRSPSCCSHLEEDDTADDRVSPSGAASPADRTYRRAPNCRRCKHDSEQSASSLGEGVDSPGITRRGSSQNRDRAGSLDHSLALIQKGVARLSTDDGSNGSSCSSLSARLDPKCASQQERRPDGTYAVDLSGGWSSSGEGEGYEYECKRVALDSPSREYGLFFCRGGDDVVSSVFVSEIDEGLPAARNGDISVGDLVLEINGDSVSDIEAAYEALKNNDQITLLVARPVFETIQEAFCSESEVDMLSTLHEVESEEEAPSGKEVLAAGDVNSGGLRPRALTCSNGEASTEQYAEQVQRAAKEMFTRDARVRSASAPQENNVGKKDRNSNYEQRHSSSSGSSKPAKSGHTAEKDGRSRRHHSGSDSHGSSKPATGMTPPSPKPRRSALKSSQPSAPGKETTKKSPKHVRVDTKGDWTPTEKRIWEEFKLIQSLEAEKNNGEPDLDNLDKQWSVKRSKDGEHIYIRKKLPASKSKLLRNRGQRVSEERHGITTDDDTMSVYLGRYWNRDERRRQLGRNKEKKKRLLDRLATLTELQQHPCEAEKRIAEIVQKRMTSEINWTDGFVTIDEILAQRNRSGSFNGLVHVTTV